MQLTERFSLLPEPLEDVKGFFSARNVSRHTPLTFLRLRFCASWSPSPILLIECRWDFSNSCYNKNKYNTKKKDYYSKKKTISIHDNSNNNNVRKSTFFFLSYKMIIIFLLLNFCFKSLATICFLLISTLLSHFFFYMTNIWVDITIWYSLYVKNKK